MKTAFKAFLGASLMTTLAVSCGPSQSEYNAVVAENKALKNEVASLTTVLDACKAELEQYQTSPDILFSQAQSFIASKDVNGLRSICTKLEKYHPESPECKQVQDALQKLNDEIERAAAAEKAKRMKAVNKLKKEFDDVSGNTWYYNPYFTHYNNSNHVSVYMGKRASGKPWLRLKMSYYGSGWIFFDKAYLSYDGNTLEIPFDEYKDKKTDNYTECWEWIDVPVSDRILSFLKELVNGKSAKSRLSGKYTNTHNLTKVEIDGIKDVLLAYDVLLNGE